MLRGFQWPESACTNPTNLDARDFSDAQTYVPILSPRGRHKPPRTSQINDTRTGYIGMASA